MCGFTSHSLKRQQDFWLFLLADIYFYRCIGPTIKDAVRRGRSRLPALFFFFAWSIWRSIKADEFPHPLNACISCACCKHSNVSEVSSRFLKCKASCKVAHVWVLIKSSRPEVRLMESSMATLCSNKTFPQALKSLPRVEEMLRSSAAVWESRSRYEFCKELFLPERTYIH